VIFEIYQEDAGFPGAAVHELRNDAVADENHDVLLSVLFLDLSLSQHLLIECCTVDACQTNDGLRRAERGEQQYNE